MIPYEFTYGINSHIMLSLLDTVINIAFIIDILINFRTIYKDEKTGEDVKSARKIAINYVFYGRFFVDLIASTPIELINALSITSSNNLKFLGILKLVRLLRLGRMITFLKAKQELKFSIKIGQLIFFILLTLHWINCLWYYVTDNNETWFPPKDLDFRHTDIYTAQHATRYNIFYYYAVIILVGNEVLPKDHTQLGVLTILAFLSTVLIGIVIGEFVSLLSAITKQERQKNDDADILNNCMATLRISEGLQNRVIEYYDNVVELKFIKQAKIDNLVSKSLIEVIMLYQTNYKVSEIKFINPSNFKQMERLTYAFNWCFFLENDIIIKQDECNEYFYYIHEGIVEVIIESMDFMYFNHKHVKNFISQIKDMKR